MEAGTASCGLSWEDMGRSWSLCREELEGWARSWDLGELEAASSWRVGWEELGRSWSREPGQAGGGLGRGDVQILEMYGFQ